ncbi:MAG TPA: hypothetical protein VI230_08485, partial [Ignavibacteriaceae bacterium]
PPVKLKYLYMGLNIESSNHALPTSRFIYYLKVYKYKKKNKDLKHEKLKNLSLHKLHDDRKNDSRGMIGAAARLINRLAEEWYRLIISIVFQLRGYVVLYDRHFLFDAATSAKGEALKRQRLSSKIHRWILVNLYEKPDMTIFLEAPADVLFARKGEADLEYLKARNEAFLEVGKGLNNFFRIDATQSPEKVFENVIHSIHEIFGPKNQSKKTAMKG